MKNEVCHIFSVLVICVACLTACGKNNNLEINTNVTTDFKEEVNDENTTKERDKKENLTEIIEVKDNVEDDKCVSETDIEAYSVEELENMAFDYYELKNKERAQKLVSDVEGEEVTIHLFDDVGNHVATRDWYTINIYTACGTDFFGNEIDLTEVKKDVLDDFVTSINENESIFIESIQNYDDKNYIVNATICEPYIIPKTEEIKENVVIDNKGYCLFEVQSGEYYNNKIYKGIYKENAGDIWGYYILEDGSVLDSSTECTMIVYKVTSRNIKFKMSKEGFVGYTHVDVPLLDVFEIGTNYNKIELEKLFVHDYSIYQPIFENGKCIGLLKCNEGH